MAGRRILVTIDARGMAVSGIEATEIVCSCCGKRFEQSPGNAADSIICQCGARVPVRNDENLTTAYDLAPEGAPDHPVANPLTPSAAQPRTLTYRPPKDDVPPRADHERIRDLYLPLWLLGGGVVVEIVAAAIRERELDAALIHVGMELVVGTVLMLAGIVVVARLRRINFGRLWVAIFKLTAVSVAPAAAVALITPALNVIPLGGLLGCAGEFVLYFTLLGALFDLEQSDTWYCVCVIFLVQLTVYFFLLWIVGR